MRWRAYSTPVEPIVGRRGRGGEGKSRGRDEGRGGNGGETMAKRLGRGKRGEGKKREMGEDGKGGVKLPHSAARSVSSQTAVESKWNRS